MANWRREGAAEPDHKSRDRVPDRPTLDRRVARSMRGAVDRGFVMAMFNWAIVALKVLLFIWAAQLTWMGSRLNSVQIQANGEPKEIRKPEIRKPLPGGRGALHQARVRATRWRFSCRSSLPSSQSSPVPIATLSRKIPLRSRPCALELISFGQMCEAFHTARSRRLVTISGF